MKYLIASIFVVSLFARAGYAQQFNQDTTSTPPQPQGQQGWVQVPSGTTYGLSHLAFVSEDTAFTGDFKPMRSTDGGMSWQPFSIPQQWLAFFYNSQIAYVVDNGNTAGCYYTHDGGQNWTLANDSNQRVVQVVTIGPDTAYVIGGYVTKTTDGGKTWGHPVYGQWEELNGAAFYDSQHGIVVGVVQSGPPPIHHEQTAGCFTTSDGGQTWTQQYTGAYSDFYGVTMVTPDTLIAAALLSKIYRSVNGGSTWSMVDTLNSGAHLLAISSHHSSNFVVGRGGTILYSNDRGSTWIQQKSGVTSDLLSVAVFDDSLALVAGNDGVILRTTNAGTAWVQTSPPSPVSLNCETYPEPTQGQLQISYSLPQLQDVTVSVIDVTGRTVATPIIRQIQTQGQHTLAFDGSKLPTGSYSYVIRTERFVGSGKFTIVR